MPDQPRDQRENSIPGARASAEVPCSTSPQHSRSPYQDFRLLPLPSTRHSSQEVTGERPHWSSAIWYHCRLQPNGGTEFIIRRGRACGNIARLALFVLGAVRRTIVYAGARFLFPLVSDIRLAHRAMMVFMTFGESRIVVEEGHVSVRNSLFGLMTGRRMPCSSIKRIGVKGDARGSARGYYSVTFTQEDEKTVSPIQFLGEKRHADWLAEEVRKAMEPWRIANRR